jgi:hypothetical protein
MASALGSATLKQLLSHPFVIKLISEFKAPTNYFSQVFGLGLNRAAGVRRSGNVIQWDIFNHTRQLAQARPRLAGPGTATNFPVQTKVATMVRLHEKTPFLYDTIMNTRPLGGNYGTLDKAGETIVARNLKNFLMKFSNSREFMVQHMLRGGFDIKITGDEHVLTTRGSGTVTVDYGFASDHLDAGVTEIEDWTNASTDIIANLLALNRRAELETGLPLKHVFGNTKLYQYLMNNTKLQAQGGSAFRVWETLTGRSVDTMEGSRPTSGFSVEFRAFPLFQFHFHDGYLAIDTDDDGSLTAALPDNKVLITPDPGDWLDLAEGSEIVQEDYSSAPKEVFGMHSWSTPLLDPAGREFKFLSNELPLIYIPKAVFWATYN